MSALSPKIRRSWSFPLVQNIIDGQSDNEVPPTPYANLNSTNRQFTVFHATHWLHRHCSYVCGRTTQWQYVSCALGTTAYVLCGRARTARLTASSSCFSSDCLSIYRKPSRAISSSRLRAHLRSHHRLPPQEELPPWVGTPPYLSAAAYPPHQSHAPSQHPYADLILLYRKYQSMGRHPPSRQMARYSVNCQTLPGRLQLDKRKIPPKRSNFFSFNCFVKFSGPQHCALNQFRPEISLRVGLPQGQ